MILSIIELPAGEIAHSVNRENDIMTHCSLLSLIDIILKENSSSGHLKLYFFHGLLPKEQCRICHPFPQ